MDVMSDSSDDDDNGGNEQKMAVLQRIFKDYGDTLQNSPKSDQLSDQYMQERIQQHSLTCLICISSVKRENKIWTCCSCFDTFHLTCIQQWVRDGIVSRGVLSDDLFPDREIPWNCPKCRFAFDRKNVPFKYLCFCGKQENPISDPWLAAHSCGQKCERMLRPNCGHRCMLLCHPGPCPPCPKMVMTSCFCGRTKNAAKRCGSALWSCGGKCGKKLKCGKHSCNKSCHEGPCQMCPRTLPKSCVCGKHRAEKACGVFDWQCEEECGKKLPCGIHKCAKMCHRGSCGECPKSGLRTCPCGASQKVNLPCSEDVPTCNDTCGKSWGCSKGHKCSRRCHYGSCDQCVSLVVKKCRCGKRQKELPCSKLFTCNIKCQKLRDCGIHQCKRVCCNGECPSCDQVCRKTLPCKQHKCQLMCHRGRCFPCNLDSALSCNCGSATLLVPCGKEKTSKPPRCNKLCAAMSSCHHPKRQPHKCHFGKCPPCTQICNMALNCGHQCKERCHDEVLVEAKVKAAGPWELSRKPNFIVQSQPCPPCRHGVSVKCFGAHEEATLPCSQAKSYSCGRPCNQTLGCEIHKCEKQCHVVDNTEHPNLDVTPCMDCDKPCLKPRPDGCPHECSSGCHTGPCKRCKKPLRVQCHCGIMELKFLCCDFTSAVSKEDMLSCGNQCQKPLQCGHPCGKPCHKGKCVEECHKKVIVRCKCKRKKKEFSCPEARDKPSIPCDEICEEKLLQKEAVRPNYNLYPRETKTHK